MKAVKTLVALLILSVPAGTVFTTEGLAQDIDREASVIVSTDAGNEDTLYVGIDSSATNLIDPELGEQELPPPPPGFDARLLDDEVAGEGFGEGLGRDYRFGTAGYDSTKSHQIAYQATDEATEVTIRWSLPSDSTGGTIEDKFGGDIYQADLTQQDSIVVQPGDPDAILTLDYPVEDSSQTVKFEVGPKTAPVATTVYGDSASMPVSIDNFESVSTVQFTLKWDPSIAKFAKVKNFSLPGMDESNFGTPKDSSIPDGTLTFSWNDPDGETVTLEDGKIIFGLILEGNTEDGDSTLVSFESSPTPQEVSVNYNPIPAYWQDGAFAVLSDVEIAGGTNYHGYGYIPVPKTDLILGDTTITTESGFFSIGGLDPTQEYTLSASRQSIDPDKAITTLDIVRMRRFILGADSLDGAAQIAADVNGSESVTTLDVSQTRRLVLSVIGSFEAPFWRFVPDDHEYEDPPFSAPSSYEYTDLGGNLDDQSFEAIKRGDVNGSWRMPDSLSENSKPAPNTLTDEDPEFELAIGDVSGAVGDTISVSISAQQAADLSALQFTTQWPADQLSLMEVVGGAVSGMSPANFGTHASEEGVLTVAWTDPEGETESFSEGQTIATLEFRITGSDPALGIGSSPTKAVAYDGGLNPMAVTGAAQEPVQGDLKVLPSRPNPATERATLKYFLPEQTAVQVQVYNVIGQRVKTMRSSGRKGWQSIDMDLSGLSSGLYLVRLKAGEERRTQRLTVIR